MELTWEDQWIGYDDAGTIARKKSWANNQCFGGTMTWSVDFASGAGKYRTLPGRFIVFANSSLVAWNLMRPQTELVGEDVAIRSAETGRVATAAPGQLLCLGILPDYIHTNHDCFAIVTAGAAIALRIVAADASLETAFLGAKQQTEPAAPYTRIQSADRGRKEVAAAQMDGVEVRHLTAARAANLDVPQLLGGLHLSLAALRQWLAGPSRLVPPPLLLLSAGLPQPKPAS
jgi:hypothetical protein